MQDPQYRLSIVWQNVAYNQPPHTSFFMGQDMPQPPKPNIVILKRNNTSQNTNKNIVQNNN